MKLSEQIRQMEAKKKKLESDCMKLIDERDTWEEKATRLAESIGDAVGFDVGEHSSANCPVERADEAVWIAAKNKKKAEAFDWLALHGKDYHMDYCPDLGWKLQHLVYTDQVFEGQTFLECVRKARGEE